MKHTLLLLVLSILAISCQTSKPVKPDEFIRVTIKGWVKSPGTYSIPEDTKVNDLIAFAGGYHRGNQDAFYTKNPASLIVTRGNKTIKIPFGEWKSKKWETFRFLNGDVVYAEIYIF